jgi:hypothetical protein
MDTFPGLVIYTALLALSRRPESWAELHNGENILFSAEDFDPPFRTRTWQFLAGLRDAEVDHAAERLMRACDPTWQAGNTLESLLDGRPRVEVPAQRKTIEATPFPGVAAQADRGTPWWERAGGTASAAGTPGPRAPSGVAAPPPTASAMPPPPPKQAPGTAPTPASPSFAGAGPAQPWYQPSGQGPRPHPAPRPPAHQRPGRAVALLVLAIAVLILILVLATA